MITESQFTCVHGKGRSLQAHNHESSTFALVATAATLVGAHPLPALALGCLGAIVADWPDIDAEKSRVIRLLWWAPWFPWLLKNVSAMVFDACATPADRRDTTAWGTTAFRVHRGFWHSVWGALSTGAAWWGLLGLAGAWWPPGEAMVTEWVGLGVPAPLLVAEVISLGMIGHVLGDGCTDFGVAPFAPVLYWRGRRYVRMGLWTPLRFKVDKAVENVLITPLCVGLVLWAVAGMVWGPWSAEALCGLGAGVLWALIPTSWARKVLKPWLPLVPTKYLRKRVRKLLIVK